MNQGRSTERASAYRFILAILALGLLVASCGPSQIMPTVPVSQATTTLRGQATTTLAGEPFSFGPQEGEVLAVVGVAHDDVLNVRAVPGIGGDVVAELEPLGDQVVATGRARLLPTSIWYEVTVGGATGWVNSSFVGFLGDTDDATSEVTSELGETPTAGTMVDLGVIVAGALASTDPPSVITMVVAPTVGDLGEVTYDAVGFGDDAVLGVRLHVFGQPNGEEFTLETVERTWLCGRGVTEEGLCV